MRACLKGWITTGNYKNYDIIQADIRNPLRYLLDPVKILRHGGKGHEEKIISSFISNRCSSNNTAWRKYSCKCSR